ncbi:MAG TPA: ChbG/HpnK family deacetylase [Pyrinomonadaceae bacterium]
MKMARQLIVNADDFGQSHGINRGVIQAFENGIVTSASLMVRWPAAPEAADYARKHPNFSLGLHLDLCEWICRDDKWEPLYEVVAADDADAVREEVERQLDTFEHLVGHEPSHLDSHQHVHRTEPVRSIMVETARRLAVPLRDFSNEVKYCGRFYGQGANGYPYPEGISVPGLIACLRSLPAGVTELGCHPGGPDDLTSMYTTERMTELEVLCDPAVRAAIVEEEIRLSSFLNLAVAPIGV